MYGPPFELGFNLPFPSPKDLLIVVYSCLLLLLFSLYSFSFTLLFNSKISPRFSNFTQYQFYWFSFGTKDPRFHSLDLQQFSTFSFTRIKKITVDAPSGGLFFFSFIGVCACVCPFVRMSVCPFSGYLCAFSFKTPTFFSQLPFYVLMIF